MTPMFRASKRSNIFGKGLYRANYYEQNFIYKSLGIPWHKIGDVLLADLPGNEILLALTEYEAKTVSEVVQLRLVRNGTYPTDFGPIVVDSTGWH